MPVQKFRSFQEASRALAEAGTSDRDSLPDRVAGLWALAASLVAPLEFRGVRKYRSIEDANEDRRNLTVSRQSR